MVHWIWKREVSIFLIKKLLNFIGLGEFEIQGGLRICGVSLKVIF